MTHGNVGSSDSHWQKLVHTYPRGNKFAGRVDLKSTSVIYLILWGGKNGSGGNNTSAPSLMVCCALLPGKFI